MKLNIRTIATLLLLIGIVSACNLPTASPKTEFTGEQGLPLESNLIIKMTQEADGYHYTMTGTQEGSYSLAGVPFVNGVIITSEPIQMTHYASASQATRNGQPCANLDYIDTPDSNGIKWEGKYICPTDTAPTPASDAPAPTESAVAVSAPVVNPNEYVMSRTADPFEVIYQKGSDASMSVSFKYEDPTNCGSAQQVTESGLTLGEFTASLRLGDSAIQVFDKFGTNVANMGTSAEKPCFTMTVNGSSWTVTK